MTQNKTQAAPTTARGEPVRQRVMDAAERLLRRGKADFSMRDLAARRIDTMAERFAGMSPPADAAGRVLLAIDTAVEVMLEEPEINRAVMGWIGTAGPSPGRVLAHSTCLWSLALGTGEGLNTAGREKALNCLASQLAFAFRGVLSFWTAGELPDEALAPHARELAKTLLLGFSKRQQFCDSVS